MNRKRRKWLWAAPVLGMLSVLLIVLGGVFLAMSNSGGLQPASGTPARPAGPSVYAPQPGQQANLPAGRTYFVQQTGNGDELMYTDDGSDNVLVAQIPNGFGTQAGDTVGALALSPGARYLAIDGQTDHGDTVWVASTTGGVIRQVPGSALGNFLHWLPDGEHFLFRPYLPQGPVAGSWNPGLWIVDAATGDSVNLPLPDGATSANLIDAVSDPSGSHIVLSLTAGLGTGSSVWMVTPDGLHSERLFQSSGDVGLLAWSPDGSRLAYEEIVDSVVPFRPAALWMMTPDGQRTLMGQADGGHGFAPVWSPDGRQLAFVARLNAGDGNADNDAGALVSAIDVLNAQNGAIATVASPSQTGLPRNFAPAWGADGKLIFTAMPASSAISGPALVDGTLWSATPASTAKSAASFTVAPLGNARQNIAADLAAVVP
jgi:Tol biopolymer transport system component